MKQYKTCTKCQREQTLDCYTKDKGRKDGLFPWCKTCVSADAKARYQKNKEAIKKKVRDYRALNKEAAYKRTRAWVQANADHNREYQKNWARQNRKKNPTAHRRWPKDASKLKEWRKNNPEKYRLQKIRRRTLEKQAAMYKVTPKEINRMLASNCFYCNESPAEHIDHVIPLSKSGTSSIGNLVGACRTCNLRKSDRFVMQWRLIELKSNDIRTAL